MNKIWAFTKPRLLIGALVAALIVSVFPVGVQFQDGLANTFKTLTIGSQERLSLTIGPQKAYAAGTIDYTYDGVPAHDTSNITALLAHLATHGGGEMVTLTANVTVTGAITVPANVTIRGTGSSSYFARNGVDPIFIASANDTFYDLRFDNGGITVLTDTQVFNVTEGVVPITVAGGLIQGSQILATDTVSAINEVSTTNLTATNGSFSNNVTVSGNLTAKTGRAYTYTFAATDSTALEKAQADVVIVGNADDEIMAKEAIIEAAGRGSLGFYPGTYSISTNLTISSSFISWQGSGRNIVKFNAINPNVTILTIGDAHNVANVAVKGIGFNGQYLAGVIGIKVNAPEVGQTNTINLEDLRIDECRGGAIRGFGWSNSSARTVIMSNNGDNVTLTPAVYFNSSTNAYPSNSLDLYGFDLESSNYTSVYVGENATGINFYALVLDLQGYVGIIDVGERNQYFGVSGIQGGNADFIRLINGTSGYSRLHKFYGINMDFDPSVTKATAVNMTGTGGSTGLNEIYGITALHLPAGTTLISDNQPSGNIISGASATGGEAGTIYNITNTGTIVYPSFNPSASGLGTKDTLSYGANVTTDAAIANVYYLSVSNNVSFTMKNPTNSMAGKIITYNIGNDSGGAMGTITWDTTFHLAGSFVNPANGTRRSITFYFAGSNWFEISRNANDVS